jgi:asparagine synthase (glutamine-hydrolysing)
MACLLQDGGMRDRHLDAPAVSGSSGHVVVAHARLDNRKELLDGRVAEMASDAELILSLMQRRSEQAIERLIGDFAFAWWDADGRQLHLARDAMGMRTLYYRLDHDRVLFASEAHQLLAVSGVPKRLNDRAVAWHLAGMQTPSGISFYDGIEELEPSQHVRVSLQGQCRRNRFWQAIPRQTLHYRDDREYVEHLREILLEAVRCRLHSVDGPVAISLSGGMDSASVASMAGWLKQQGEPVASLRAYSWAFNEFPQCDERDNIYRVASAYHIPVNEIDAGSTYPLHDLSLHVPHPDDPFMTMYQAFTHKGLMAARNDGARSMIYGIRGDVMCGGDVNALAGLVTAGRWHEVKQEWLSLRRSSSQPPSRVLFARLLKPLLFRWTRPRSRYLARRVAHGLGLASPDSRLGADHVNHEFLVQHGVTARAATQAELPFSVNDAGRQRHEHVFSSFATRALINAARCAASHGMAVLDPWSDRRLASFVLACPQHQITRASDFKRLPRLAMKGIMPSQAIGHAKKVSPEPLYERALRNEAHDNVMTLIRNSRCASLGYVDGDRLSRDFDDYVRGRRPIFDLWSTLSLELWLRSYWGT